MPDSRGLEAGLVDSADGLEALWPEWAELYARSRFPNPFLSAEWTAACWKHICAGGQPFVPTLRREGRLVGAAPLCLQPRLGFRVLRFIGDGRSDYLGFLTDPDEPGAEERLSRALAERRGAWDLAVLRQLAEGYTRLGAGAEVEGLAARGTLGTVAPYLALGEDWNALVSQGPSSVRRGKRAAKKFVKDGGRIERLTGPDAAGAVETIADVERRSWKGRKGAARFQPGPGQRLLQEALATLGAAGGMEVWIAHFEAKPVAFQINFLTPDRLLYYQGAYDEEYRKTYAGFAVHYTCMERSWQAGIREYDFMSGDEAYKSGWCNAEREIRYRALFPATARGHLAYAALIAPRWRLKDSAWAHAALRLAVQLRNNPMGLLRAPAVVE